MHPRDDNNHQERPTQAKQTALKNAKQTPRHFQPDDSDGAGASESSSPKKRKRDDGACSSSSSSSDSTDEENTELKQAKESLQQLLSVSIGGMSRKDILSRMEEVTTLPTTGLRCCSMKWERRSIASGMCDRRR